MSKPIIVVPKTGNVDVRVGGSNVGVNVGSSGQVGITTGSPKPIDIDAAHQQIDIDLGARDVVDIDIGGGSPGPPGVPGIPGEPGVPGQPGPPGPPGGTYTFIQPVPAQVWNVVHPLPFYPNVVVVDSAGTVVEGDLTYGAPDQITLTFSAAFSGSAYLS